MIWAILGGLISAVAIQAASTDPPANVRQIVRVGVVAFEDFHLSFEHHRKLCAEIARQDPSLRVSLATGTYGDVLHWLDHGLIDVAYLPPGVFASTQAEEEASPAAPRFLPLAGIGLPPANSHWTSGTAQEANYRDTYRSLCLVPKNSSLTSVDKLQEAAQRGEVEFLFVHPLSAGGCIAPRYALKQLGIEPRPGEMHFTYSHSESLRLAAQAPSEKLIAAFVWDGTTIDDPVAASLRVLPIPELERLEISQDIVVARRNFDRSETIQRVLLQHVDDAGHHDFHPADQAIARSRKIGEWILSLNTGGDDDDQQAVSLDEIGQMLVHHARSQPSPPRLAVVLSGGGAKCAYQVGAVAGLEERLAALRDETRLAGLDIALVVGTSGGAINAVPIALGVTATPEGRADFERTWSQLDQRNIVRPSAIVCANIGLWFALLNLWVVIRVARFFVGEPKKRANVIGGALIGLGAFELICGFLPAPWRWLGPNHMWHHLWLWLSFGVHACAWTLIVVGIGVLFIARKDSVRERLISFPPRVAFWGLIVCLSVLPLIQIITVLWFQQTLSGGHGMEAAIANKFPPLINAQLQRDGQSPLKLDDSIAPSQRVQQVSRQLIERGAFHRDLVITGSCLEQSAESLPSDLYFYAVRSPAASNLAHSDDDGKADADRERSDSTARAPNSLPPFGARGIPLSEHPNILMDVVLGSGSIYPVFPPRDVVDFPTTGETISLVDGGFAHNSPVEAAVLWGATHIVLIEASPKVRITRDNFLTNAVDSFDHLYAQAQLLDAHSRGQVLMFTLAPEPPHICVLDFANNLIEQAIATGYHDANRTAADGTPPFRKEAGQPLLVEIRAEE